MRWKETGVWWSSGQGDTDPLMVLRNESEISKPQLSTVMRDSNFSNCQICSSQDAILEVGNGMESRDIDGGKLWP